MNHAAAISEHVTQINELRKTIAYCEGRILRKQIAIEELQLGHDIPEYPVARVEPPTLATPDPVKISIAKMIAEILPEFAGKTFWYSDLKQRLLEKWPAHEHKICRTVHSVAYTMISDGKILRTPGGFQVP